MELHDVARKLGFVLNPTQEVYRFYRRQGISKSQAREYAHRGAPTQAAMQTQAVMNFIWKHAVWTIPDEAWPSR